MNRLGLLVAPVLAAGGLGACTIPAPPPLSCVVTASPIVAKMNKTEYVTVKTAPGVLVTTTVHYVGTKGYVKLLRANSAGVARTAYASGSGPGRVSVLARVVRGSAARTCSTAFTTVATPVPLPPHPTGGSGSKPLPPPPPPPPNYCQEIVFQPNYNALTLWVDARAAHSYNILAHDVSCATARTLAGAANDYTNGGGIGAAASVWHCIRTPLSAADVSSHYACASVIAPEVTIDFDYGEYPLTQCDNSPPVALGVKETNIDCATALDVANFYASPSTPASYLSPYSFYDGFSCELPQPTTLTQTYRCFNANRFQYIGFTSTTSKT